MYGRRGGGATSGGNGVTHNKMNFALAQYKDFFLLECPHFESEGEILI